MPLLRSSRSYFKYLCITDRCKHTLRLLWGTVPLESQRFPEWHTEGDQGDGQGADRC